MNPSINRRQLLAGSACLLPVASLLRNNVAYAADAPQVDPEDAQAKALQYIHQSEKPDQLCKNCQLYQGTEGKEWGACAIFPGKSVNANGWCVSWVKKTV